MHTRTAIAVATLLAFLSGCTSGSSTPDTAASPAPATSSGGLTGEYASYAAGLSRPVVDSQYPQHGTDAVDVLHYGLELAWSPTARVLTGTATLHIRPTRDAASVSLDFKPYTITSLTVGGQPATGAVTKEKLVVQTPVKADVPFTLVVGYQGKPSTTPWPTTTRGDNHPLGLTVSADGGLWTMQEPFGAFTWYPANDHPSDEALYDIAVTAPPGWSAIASGTPQGQQGDTFRYRSTVPVASYLTTLAVGKYEKATGTGPHGLPITYWYHADEASYLPMMQKTAEHLQWLEKHFGPYPFDSAGVVMVESPSAMETQQMVTMGERFGQMGPRSFDGTLLHEWAHHWFGDAVTPADWSDFWLNEGWALYAQRLYEAETYPGEMSPAERIAQNRELDGTYRKQYGPPGKPNAAEFGNTCMYTCVAGMLRQLHQALGDDRFFALARGWVQDNLHTQQNRASFTAYVNRKTGHDFTALLDAWLDSPTTPAETGPLPS
ncbi:M1 family metallopeptidase [Catellatospora citrea]|uniref:Aminopeptidase N n=1 Tax=Catellatospora citrea TaxID=53366 RepID=A0A8J3KG56_9ACTN|nr:M1 family metallopeptidase [Catellatospora citrea]RKE05359.1 peptidase M1-like protein [Catellatospora citrea]GIF98288.1 peptidase [Catellatospora citrea]